MWIECFRFCTKPAGLGEILAPQTVQGRRLKSMVKVYASNIDDADNDDSFAPTDFPERHFENLVRCRS